MLRPYQRDGAQFLASSQSALLADEMGLGKTVQAAQAMRMLDGEGTIRRSLVVAPASLLTNWYHELVRWGPAVAVRSSYDLDATERATLWQLPIPIVVTSYDTLRADFLPRAPVKHFDLVVFDEAQRLKNPRTETALAARRLNADRCWALSATPLENGVGDLATLAQVLGLLPYGLVEPTIAALIESLQGHFLRRRKIDVLPELPPVLTQEIPLRLSGHQLDEYQTMRSSADIANSDSIHLLALINTLKQLCNRASDGSSVKLETLLEILNDPGIGDARLIVISQYTETLDWLAQRLPVRCLQLDGRMDYAARDATLEAFRQIPTPVVLLLSLKAGGVGLNIPEATHVILFDRWWNPAVEDQAIHRAHRFGRRLPLLAYRFRVIDSIEDKIVEISQTRQGIFDEVIEQELSERARSHRWAREDLLRMLE